MKAEKEDMGQRKKLIQINEGKNILIKDQESIIEEMINPLKE